MGFLEYSVLALPPNFSFDSVAPSSRVGSVIAEKHGAERNEMMIRYSEVEGEEEGRGMHEVVLQPNGVRYRSGHSADKA